MTYRTLVQPLVDRARQKPWQLALVFINEDGSQERVTAQRFHEDALAYGQALQRVGIQADDIVILVLRHSRAVLSSFWGALYLGAVPSIFPFLTEKLDRAIYQERVRALVAHSGARAVLTFPDFEQELCALLKDLDCRVLSTEDVQPRAATPAAAPVRNVGADGKIAFLQHSSGTTGLQKGVALSHRAVFNQIEAYSRSIGITPEDVIVSWLPLYHDMGLIAGFIMPLVLGVPLVLLSPFHWVRDPARLLWAIHEHRGTLCWLPNFAYNHSVRSVRRRDLEGLNLGHWRMVINCSEPVRHDSQQLFLKRFAPYGFRESALATCYAMAENTFAVTQSVPGEAPCVDWVVSRTLQEEQRAVPATPDAPNATPLVSCGYPIEGTEVIVVNDDGHILPERHIGEIAIRGNSMLSGYYRRPTLTEKAIRDDWYYTGDMGYLADGQLYVSGRKKDLIIVGGKNVYPQDLEAIANQVAGIHPGRAVAFGTFDERLGSEAIVMVCELSDAAGDDKKQRIERELRRRITQSTDLTLSDVRLVDRRWLIKTSSGKIARLANRDKYCREFAG